VSIMYEQATIPVEDGSTHGQVKSAIDFAFAPGHVANFLRSLQSAKLRIREFEKVIAAGILGPDTAAAYAKLGNADQGMIREHYLSSLEKVDPELRRKFLKVYAYY